MRRSSSSWSGSRPPAYLGLPGGSWIAFAAASSSFPLLAIREILEGATDAVATSASLRPLGGAGDSPGPGAALRAPAAAGGETPWRERRVDRRHRGVDRRRRRRRRSGDLRTLGPAISPGFDETRDTQLGTFRHGGGPEGPPLRSGVTIRDVPYRPATDAFASASLMSGTPTACQCAGSIPDQCADP